MDVHPLEVEGEARRQRLDNIRPIHSGCSTGLEPETIDIALLFDALHDVDDKAAVLGEIRRVLTPDGRLLYKDHTLNGTELRDLIKRNGFRLDWESEMLSFGMDFRPRSREWSG